MEVEYDSENPIVITDDPSSSTSRNQCNGRGWITRDTLLPQMQRTTLKKKISNGKILSDSTQVMTCALEELGRETTSLDPYVYI